MATNNPIFDMKVKEESFMALIKDYASYLYTNRIAVTKVDLKSRLDSLVSRALENGDITQTTVDRIYKALDATLFDARIIEIKRHRSSFLNHIVNHMATGLENLSKDDGALLATIVAKQNELNKLKYDFFMANKGAYLEATRDLVSQYRNFIDQRYVDIVDNFIVGVVDDMNEP